MIPDVDSGCDRPTNLSGEVTPKMIEAAYEFLSEHYLGDGAYDLRPERLAEMYRVMCEAR